MNPLDTLKIVVGPLATNCYILWCELTRESCIIDPGSEGETIIEKVEGLNLDVAMVLCTHAHFDHIGAASLLRDRFEAKLYIHEADLPYLDTYSRMAKDFGFASIEIPVPDITLKDDITLRIGGSKLKVIHTPGHTPGSCSIISEGRVFTGDTLFSGSMGRWDLPGGSLEDLKRSLKRLMELPVDTLVLPGHGPYTTIGREKLYNPFVRYIFE
ncbi:MAG: MBL fold metallo-hydrolase [Candidatus Bathyarchaeota archaeon]|nr:MBL fold metallo-hydrolase [Candidatus Bathyarchaeota archaeon]